MGSTSVFCEPHGRWKPWLKLSLSGHVPQTSAVTVSTSSPLISLQSHVLADGYISSLFPSHCRPAYATDRSWVIVIGWIIWKTPPTSVGSTESSHGSTTGSVCTRVCVRACVGRWFLWTYTSHFIFEEKSISTRMQTVILTLRFYLFKISLFTCISYL